MSTSLPLRFSLSRKDSSSVPASRRTDTPPSPLTMSQVDELGDLLGQPARLLFIPRLGDVQRGCLRPGQAHGVYRVNCRPSLSRRTSLLSVTSLNSLMS